jgi:hypothetical protein
MDSALAEAPSITKGAKEPVDGMKRRCGKN